MKVYLAGLLISFFFFLILILTLPHYGMHEDNPFHFLRGQAYLQKILTGKDKFNLPNKPSPVMFIPGQRISLYKPNASENTMAALRPFGISEETSLTIQEIYRGFLEKLDRRESFYKHGAWSTNIWDISTAKTHPAVSDILMALSNRIFYEKLGILQEIEAYHLYIVFVSSLCLFFVYFFSRKAFGATASLFATVSLALFPYFFAESHFNIKDPVQMSFFTIAIVSFYFFITQESIHPRPSQEQVMDPRVKPEDDKYEVRVSGKPNLRWFALLILSTFLALGTKWNIILAPFILLPWLFLIRKKKGRDARFWFFRRDAKSCVSTLSRLIFYGMLMVTVPFLLLILAWPFLWESPIPKLLNTFSFYSSLALRDVRVQTPVHFPLPLGFNAEAILRVFSMTPPFMLLFFITGIVSILSGKIRSKTKAEWLVLLWFLLPILRVSRQEAETVGSIRHFIEFLPAFCIISGIGAAKLLRVIKKRYLAYVILGIYTASLLFAIIRTHPNQNIYFNSIFGGLSGAKNSQLYSWETSYGNVYRQAVSWFNKNAPAGGKLAYLDGTMLSISPLWLRDDIRFGSYFSGFEQKGEFVISIIYPHDPPAVFEYNYLEKFLSPLYELKVNGVTILAIWQNDPRYTRQEFQKQKKLEGDFKIKPYVLGKRIVWDLNLETLKKITKLVLQPAKEDCQEKTGVFSTIVGNKESFINPYELVKDKQKIEFDFPAQEAEIIRFWDVEGNSCLYKAKVDGIYSL